MLGIFLLGQSIDGARQMSLEPFLQSRMEPLQIEEIYEKTEARKTEESVVLFDKDLGSDSSLFEEFDSPLFRFSHRIDHEVKTEDNLVYLTNVGQDRPVFKIFATDSLNIDWRFDSIDYECVEKNAQTICYSKLRKDDFIANLELFPEGLSQAEQFFVERELINLELFGDDNFIKRGELVDILIRWSREGVDLDSYKADCFEDIKVDSPYSGAICYAKEQGIVVGIDGYFFPERTANLWGVLQVLFGSFNQVIPLAPINRIPEEYFSEMHRTHAAAKLIATAYWEGLVQNYEDQPFWSNRAITSHEALEIFYRFYHWREGKKLKERDVFQGFFDLSEIYSYPWGESGLDFDIKKKSKEYESDILYQKVQLKNTAKGVGVWVPNRGGQYELLTVIDGLYKPQIKDLWVWWDEQRLKGEIRVHTITGKVFLFRPDLGDKTFESLKVEDEDYFYNLLQEWDLAPHKIKVPDHNLVEIHLSLDEEDFWDINQYRTSNDRYPVYAEFEYPTGEVFPYSGVIKTRGNASRGYIKSSFTLENFDFFEEDPAFEGDEFLLEYDELKLLAQASDPTKIKEKLYYKQFEALGGKAPNYIESVVYLNGVPLGLYQVTEPVKEEFFEQRGIHNVDYYYAQNTNSDYETNLAYNESKEETLSYYKVKGDPDLLMSLIYRLGADDEFLRPWLNEQEIMDYAIYTYITDAWDSVTHNYYVYWDQDTKQWGMFPWDGDETWGAVKTPFFEDFYPFLEQRSQRYNELFYYLNTGWEEDELQAMWNDFWERWKNLPPLAEEFDRLVYNNQVIRDWDQRIWEGVFLERRRDKYDINEELKKMRAEIEKLTIK